MSAGYAVLDVVKAQEATWHDAGGTAANVAANLAYLGWSSAIVARIGSDAAGRIVRERLETANVDVTGLQLDDAVETPIVRHEVLATRHRYQFGCPICGRGAAVHRPLDQDHSVDLADVYFFDRPSRINLLLAERHKASGRRVVYEPSTRATLEAHGRACSVASIVKYSSQRGSQLEGRLPARSVGQMRIVTHGAEGCDVCFDDLIRHISAFDVSTIDAGGAGDWMTAGLIHRLCSPNVRWDAACIAEAIEWSQALAALSTLAPGARSMALAVPRRRLAERIRAIRLGKPIRIVFDSQALSDDVHCKGCGLEDAAAPVGHVRVTPAGRPALNAGQKTT